MARTAVALACTFLMWICPAARAQPVPPSDDVVDAALEAASDQLQVTVDHLLVATSDAHDWPDTSLGCPVPGRTYAQVIVSGYVVTVDTDDGAGEVVVHTDDTGRRAVIC